MHWLSELLLRTTSAAAMADAQALAARGDQTCAVDFASGDHGILYCWGGDGDQSSGVDPRQRFPARLVMHPPGQRCVIDREHRMRCGRASIDPTVLTGGHETLATDVALAPGVGCHVDPAGQVWCWRWQDSTEQGMHPIHDYDEIQIPIRDAVAVAAYAPRSPEEDASTFCALHRDGAVDCWMPRCVDGPNALLRAATGVTELSGGRYFCALKTDGGVVCWDGAMALCADHPSPVQVVVSGITSAADVEVGETLGCALLRGGETMCWSLLPGDPDFAVASFKAGLPHATALAVGAAHACVRDRSGDPWCWGATDVNQLNDRELTEEVVEPWEIDGLGESDEIAASETRVCALDTEGHVVCWGDLGAPDGIPSWTGEPALIPGVDGASGLYSTETAAFCVERPGDTPLCWGERHSPGWEEGSCAVDPAGDVWCDGSGARGLRGCEEHLLTRGPQRVCGLGEAAEEVSRGRAHACALHPSGRVSCWGDNTFFQLGQSTETEDPADVLIGPWFSWSPLLVPGIEDAVQVVAAGDFTCTLHRDGTVRCWGANQRGQCGQGAGLPEDEPRRVALPPIRRLSSRWP